MEQQPNNTRIQGHWICMSSFGTTLHLLTNSEATSKGEIKLLTGLQSITGASPEDRGSDNAISQATGFDSLVEKVDCMTSEGLCIGLSTWLSTSRPCLSFTRPYQDFGPTILDWFGQAPTRRIMSDRGIYSVPPSYLCEAYHGRGGMENF